MGTAGRGATGPDGRRPGSVGAAGSTSSTSGRWTRVTTSCIRSTIRTKSSLPVLARMGHRVHDLAAHGARIRAHDHDAVAEEHGLLDEMRDEDDRREAARALGEEPIDLGAKQLRREDVERGERLVHAEQLRPAHERAGDSDALLHAARELLREGALVPFEADRFERRSSRGRRPRTGAGAGRSARPARSPPRSARERARSSGTRRPCPDGCPREGFRAVRRGPRSAESGR